MSRKFLLVLLLLTLCAGCQPTPAPDPTQAAVPLSDPKLTYTVSACDESKLDQPAEVKIIARDQKVVISQDLKYVCCAKIALDLTQEGELLKITETNTGEYCKCICAYHIDAEISGLAPGNHPVEVWGVAYQDQQPEKLAQGFAIWK